MNSLYTYVIAYRCPNCGGGVISAENAFSLPASDSFRMRCTCHGSHMTVIRSREDAVTLTAPCAVCRTAHTYTVSRALFGNRDIFTLPCPVSELNTVVIGEPNRVKAVLAEEELLMSRWLDDEKLKEYFGKPIPGQENDEDVAETLDPALMQTLESAVGMLFEEEKVFCRCEPGKGKYELSWGEDGLTVSCTACGSSRTLACVSNDDAERWLTADSLDLTAEKVTYRSSDRPTL